MLIGLKTLRTLLDENGMDEDSLLVIGLTEDGRAVTRLRVKPSFLYDRLALLRSKMAEAAKTPEVAEVEVLGESGSFTVEAPRGWNDKVNI